MFKQKLLSMVLLAGLLLNQAVPLAKAAICDQAQFISDLTAPDGTSFPPGTAFTKTWRLKNIGTCTWTTAYKVVFTGGDQMGTATSVGMPVNVAPNQMVDISVKLTAPATSGHYKGLWMISNATKIQFGIGASGTDPFWVDINVIDNKAVVYDFMANASYAQWKSGAGALPFGVTGGDDRGYVYQVNNPHLEDDSIDTSPGLMTVPQNKAYGYIQGTYPEIDVQKGDQIQTLVNCEFAATSCYVTFKVNYLLSNGTTGTLWSWNEAYDKKFYRKTISLDSLAGKKVKFILLVSAGATASGDRALWGSPRLVRTGSTLPPVLPPTLTPMPALTPTLTPNIPPPTIVPSGCDKAAFVADVTVRDGTLFSPGTSFVKTWRLKNAGTCTWTTSYKLVFYNGDQMGAPTSINLPSSVARGTTIDLTINMIAPSAAGNYRGYWILSNANGALFGLGSNAADPFWVDVNVSGSSATVTGYDFVANACAAQWKNGVGTLPCPGTDGDLNGYVINKNSTQLEDGTMGPAPSLLLAPQFKYNGYIQGTYPLFTVQAGDRFRGNTGCAYGSSCYVTFRLDYMTATGLVKTFWSWRETSDKKNNSFDVNLAPLAGQSVRFILTVLATGYATGDRVTWTAPMIVRLDTSGQVPPTLTPSPAPITMPGTLISGPVIHELHMLDPYSGWALGDGYTLRTNNGGVTWYNVLPASGGGYFPNASRAWVLSGNILNHTIDGGRTWTQTQVPFSGGRIQFINDANGFALNGEPVGMMKMPIYLYQTTDGGATWTLKYTDDPLASNSNTSIPFSGFKSSWVFRDTLRGWIGGNTPMNGFVYLFKTTDGGTTWAQQNLTLPSGYSNAFIDVGTPQFFNANDAIMPVWMTLDVGKRDLFIYYTRDGGTTWARSTSFARQGWNADFVSLTNGFTWNIGGYLQKTTTTGASWTQVTSTANFADDIPIMDFVSTTTGWVVQNQVNGVSPLYRTLDGGKTWTLLSPNQQTTTVPAPVVTDTPTATSAPQGFSTFSQTVVDALNSHNFDVAKSNMNQSFVFAFWGSQGTSVSVDQAIQQLQTNYIGTTPLVPNADKDLSILLGGANPYTIMGLDPNNSQGLYVSGWGLNGTDEAILYFTRLPDGTIYWHSTLIAQGGFLQVTPVAHDAFCGDSRIAPLLAQLKNSINQSNGDMLSSMISPVNGLDVRLWAYADPVKFDINKSKTIFTNTTAYNWGGGPSGQPDVGTFKDILQPKLSDVLNAPNMETYCDDLTKVFPLANPWPYPDMHYYNLYKPATAAGFDFRTWLVGFEYINGQPYLSALVTIIWEP